jgi:ABC-2 type transport system permease protein
VSLAVAGTDLENHLRFLEQAEAHRFDMVQRLNRMHAEDVALVDDAARNSDPLAERRSRVSRRNWADIPDFSFAPEPAASRSARALRSLGVLAAWLVAVLALVVVAARALDRAAR